jgi:single-strand DNA-binding protein
LLGRLGKDPEMKVGQSGTAVCRFSLATTEKYNGQEQTEWHSLVAFGRRAEISDQYMTKGPQVYIEGRIWTRKWTDKDKRERMTTEIIVGNLQMLGGEPGRSGQKPTPTRATRGSSPFDEKPGQPPTDNDLPF